MVLFIAGQDATQDADGSLLVGLLDRYALEAALQCAVLFDVAAIFRNGGGSHHLNLPAGELWPEDVGGINRAFRRSGSDDVVQFVDKQDDVLGIGRFLHHVFDPLLKLAAVLGSGNHRHQIQSNQPLAADGTGNAALCNPLCQSFGDGGFSNPSLSNQAGVVFASSAEDADDPFDFLVAPNHGVQLFAARLFGQVGSEFVQQHGVGSVLLFGRGVLAGFLLTLRRKAHRLVQLPIQHNGVCPQLGQKSHAVAVLFPKHRHQDMFGADQLAFVFLAFHHALLQNPSAPRGHVGQGEFGLNPSADRFDQQVQHGFRVDALLQQSSTGRTAALQQQAQQKMLAADVGVSKQARLRYSEIDGIVCPQGKAAESKHSITILRDFDESAKQQAHFLALVLILIRNSGERP